MIVLMVNHDVEDYDRFKAVFDEFPPSKGGAAYHRLNRGVDEPNNITIEAGFESADAAKAFRDDPGLRDAMGRAGVVGHPRIEIFEEIEAVSD